MQARCGLAAVRAEKLTRSDIYQALKARRTYATSGIRAYVDFSINGHEMGTEFTISSTKQPRKMDIAVAAPERITKLEVVRNGKVIADLADGNWFVQTTITDKQPIPKGAFYSITCEPPPSEQTLPGLALSGLTFAGHIDFAITVDTAGFRRG